MNRALVSVILGLAAAALIVDAPACSGARTQAIIQDITPAGSCIASALLSGGVTDPLQILAMCGGTTIDSIVAVIESLMAAQPDGGAVAARLAEAHSRAMAAKGVVIVKPGAK